jgi:ubiquinone biosynthesis protein UbiJ
LLYQYKVELRFIITELDVELEEQLSKLFGDVVAHRFNIICQDLCDWTLKSSNSFALNATEYLQQELQLLPPRYLIRQFLKAVDTISEDIDLLAARIERLGRVEKV